MFNVVACLVHLVVSYCLFSQVFNVVACLVHLLCLTICLLFTIEYCYIPYLPFVSYCLFNVELMLLYCVPHLFSWPIARGDSLPQKNCLVEEAPRAIGQLEIYLAVAYYLFNVSYYHTIKPSITVLFTKLGDN